MNSRKKDEQTLMVLHLTDNGLTCQNVGKMFGLTKNSVIGLRDRIRKTSLDLDFCTNPENINGGMRSLWWKI